MTADRIHDDEVDTSETVVQALLDLQCPQWAGCSLSYLRNTGTSNAMWRIHRPNDADLVVRMPRNQGAVGGLITEFTLMQELANPSLQLSFAVPTIAHAGEPTDAFPYPWAVLEWLDGTDAWTGRNDLELTDQFALQLAGAVSSIGSLTGLSAPDRKPGERGGPLPALLRTLEYWLGDPQWRAEDMLDLPAVRRMAAESAEVADQATERSFVHGDLIAGNLLLQSNELSAVIDWGCAAYGDPAQDLAPAWAMLDARSREVFRDALQVDDATWLRARAFELEHAVAGVLYYVPKKHPLGNVMSRTLHRLLTGE